MFCIKSWGSRDFFFKGYDGLKPMCIERAKVDSKLKGEHKLGGGKVWYCRGVKEGFEQNALYTNTK